MNQKKYEELELRDDFMFGKVMLNKAICKRTLEIKDKTEQKMEARIYERASA